MEKKMADHSPLLLNVKHQRTVSALPQAIKCKNSINDNCLDKEGNPEESTLIPYHFLRNVKPPFVLKSVTKRNNYNKGLHL